MKQLFVQRVSSFHRLCTDTKKKRAAASSERTPTGVVGAPKVGEHPDGFALLTAASGNGSTPKDPRLWRSSIIQKTFTAILRQRQ